jgi:hypothetical protein
MRPGANTLRLSSYQVARKPVPHLRGRYSRLAGPSEDRSQFDLAGNLLRNQNVQIKQLEQFVASASVPGQANPALAALGASVIEARRRYQDLLTAYIYAYGVSFGPPDTTGLQLGQWQVYVATGVGITAILAGIYELNKYLNNVQAQAQAAQSQAAANQQQQQNISYAQQQLAAAQATGDQASAAQWQKVLDANQAYQAAGGAGAGSATDFFSKNWPWFLLGGAGLLLVMRS